MNYNPIKCTGVRALNDDVLIINMDMGEQVTKGGIIIKSDDGKAHGVKPRWGQVYKVGPKQKDVAEGQWILIEHGRWTRKLQVEVDNQLIELQKVEVKSILAVTDEKPSDFYIGQEYGDGATATFDPGQFM